MKPGGRPTRRRASRPKAARRSPALVALEALMILAALAFIYPALFVLNNALKPDADITLRPVAPPTKLYLANFLKAWSEMRFPRTLANTSLITACGVGGVLLASSLAAYKLARTRGRLSWILYSAFAFALVIPFQIVMVPIVGLATDLRLSSIPGIIPMYWGLGAPLAVFMYHGFVKSVPRELEEAAAIDGAGRFYSFFRVVFPLLKPITATIAILDSLWIWNDFLLPLVVVRKGTLQLEQMQFYGMFLREYGPAAASLILSAAPIIVLYLLLQKYIIKGIASGAVKG
jgi:raffinose/stachyose/melibiose transport system permease protein